MDAQGKQATVLSLTERVRAQDNPSILNKRRVATLDYGLSKAIKKTSGDERVNFRLLQVTMQAVAPDLKSYPNLISK